MFDFVLDTAQDLGAEDCPHCGQMDYGFGILRKGKHLCLNCDKPVKEYSKEKTFEFSLTVFRELLVSYTDNITDKAVLVQFVDSLLKPLKESSVFPSNEQIIKLQAAFKAMPKVLFGGEKLDGGIFFNKGIAGLNMIPGRRIQNVNIQNLAVCLLAVQFIQGYKVENEFILLGSKESIVSAGKKSGCLGVIAMAVTLTSFFAYVIFL